MQSNQPPKITARPAIHKDKKVLRLFFPYEKNIIDKIRSIPGILWSNSMKCWYVPDTLKTLDALHKLEGLNVTIENSENLYNAASKDENKSRLLVIRYHKGRVRLIFNYAPKLVALIKTLPFYYYDAEAQWWTLPHIESVLEVLKDYCKESGWLLQYKDEWTERKVASRKKDNKYADIVTPPEFENKLKIQRYSENTIRNYCSSLKEFISYYQNKRLDLITQAEIERFLLYLNLQDQASARRKIGAGSFIGRRDSSVILESKELKA